MAALKLFHITFRQDLTEQEKIDLITHYAGHYFNLNEVLKNGLDTYTGNNEPSEFLRSLASKVDFIKDMEV